MKLIIEDDEGRKTVVPFVRDEISIGRQEGNTIRLTERNVSRRHARLLKQPGHVFVEDLGSYNGVKVNGDKIQGRAEIREGDLVEIGDYNLAVQAEAGELAAAMRAGEITNPASPGAMPNGSGASAQLTPPPAPAPGSQEPATVPTASAPPQPTTDPATRPDASAPVPAATEAPPEQRAPRESTAIIRVDFDAMNKVSQERQLGPDEAPRLVVLTTEYAGQEFEIHRSLVSIGRTDDNEIPIDHRSMSRQHCRVYLDEDGRWKVADLGSANGVRVNGEEYGLIDLRPGDILELGHVKMRFCGPGENFVFTAAMAEAYAAGGTIEVAPIEAAGTIAGIPKLPLMIGAGAFGLLIMVLAVVMLSRGDPVPGVELPDPTTSIKPVPVKEVPVPHTGGMGIPEQVAAQLAAGEEAMVNEDWARAKASFEAAVALDPASARASAALATANRETSSRRALDQGIALAADGDYETALAKLASVDPESRYHEAASARAAQARKEYASGLVVDGKAALEGKDWESASDYASRALELDSTSRAARSLQKSAKKAADKAARVARAEDRRAARTTRKPKARPTPPPSKDDSKAIEAEEMRRKGEDLIKSRKYSLAVRFLEKAIKLDPIGQKATHRNLGVAYARGGDMDKAARHYRQYVKKNPKARDADQVRQILQMYESSK